MASVERGKRAEEKNAVKYFGVNAKFLLSTCDRRERGSHDRLALVSAERNRDGALRYSFAVGLQSGAVWFAPNSLELLVELRDEDLRFVGFIVVDRAAKLIQFVH